MTNLKRLLDQSKKIRDSVDDHTQCFERDEIKDQIIAVMFEALRCEYPTIGMGTYAACDYCDTCKLMEKIEQLAAQALGEK